MKVRIAAAMFAWSVLAVIVGSGCSKSPTSLTSAFRSAMPGQGGGQDSTPVPPTPPQAPILPIAFLGSDSTAAGSSGALRWAVGNDSDAPFVVHWTLTVSALWPGYPKTGSLMVPAQSDSAITVTVAVPASQPSGMVDFTMEVTRPNGVGPTTADGWLRVDSYLPPPPPPAVVPLVYLGADSVYAGGTVTQHWRLTNESASPFTMQWTLAAYPAWPGLPQEGSLALAGGESRELATTASIPDTVAAGWRWLRLTVTRPNGLADASVDGQFLIRP
jgi:hypothetical protein